MNNFMNPENIQVLWEVLLDEPSFKNNSREEIQSKMNYFNNEIKLFYNTQINGTNKPQSLIQMNQTFLKAVLQSFGTQNQPQYSIQQSPKQLYTASDLQEERRNQFEMQLSKKKQDFDDSMILKKPPVPDFADATRNENTTSMEALLAQALEQRNMELNQIQNTISTALSSSDWLKPKETSMKSENTTGNNSAIKYIKIGREQLPPLENEIIDISVGDIRSAGDIRSSVYNEKKQISWADNMLRSDSFLNQDNKTPGILSKFKKEKTQLDLMDEKINNLQTTLEKIKSMIEKLQPTM